MARARRIDRARGGGRRPDAGCAGADAGSVARGRHRPARRLALRRHRRPGGAQHRHRREERRLARGRRRSPRARPLGRARRRSGRRGVRAAGVLRSPRALCGRSVRRRPRRRIHRQPGRLPPEGMMAARVRIDPGEQVGPRIYNSGPYFGTARPGWNAAAMTPERIRAEVDHWAARGVRGFKAKGIQPAQLSALIAEAHKHGLTVTAHLDSGARTSVNPRDAIAMGIDRIEHFMGGDAITADKPAYSSLENLDVDRPEVAAIIALFLKQNVFYDATITAYGYFGGKDPAVYSYRMNERDFLTSYARAAIEKQLPRKVDQQFEKIYQVKHREVKKFYDAGGGRRITGGTTHPSGGGFFSGFRSHRELQALVASGIPPAAAIRMATINGARALNVAAKLGTIERGKLADLFVITGNPLADIRNTHKVRLVMKSGELFDSAALLASVKGKLGPP